MPTKPPPRVQLTTALDEARSALERGDPIAAAEAAERGIRILRAASPEAIPEEIAHQARALVDGSLELARRLRADLVGQLDAARTSRRAHDAYGDP